MEPPGGQEARHTSEETMWSAEPRILTPPINFLVSPEVGSGVEACYHWRRALLRCRCSSRKHQQESAAGTADSLLESGTTDPTRLVLGLCEVTPTAVPHEFHSISMGTLCNRADSVQSLPDRCSCHATLQ